jgi:hypothetical protein
LAATMLIQTSEVSSNKASSWSFRFIAEGG